MIRDHLEAMDAEAMDALVLRVGLSGAKIRKYWTCRGLEVNPMQRARDDHSPSITERAPHLLRHFADFVALAQRVTQRPRPARVAVQAVLGDGVIIGMLTI